MGDEKTITSRDGFGGDFTIKAIGFEEFAIEAGSRSPITGEFRSLCGAVEEFL